MTYKKKDILILGKGPTDELNDTTYDYSVDYDGNGVDDILDICKYIMKKHNI